MLSWEQQGWTQERDPQAEQGGEDTGEGAKPVQGEQSAAGSGF